LGIITLRQSTRSGVNAIYVPGGLRYRLIQRYVGYRHYSYRALLHVDLAQNTRYTVTSGARQKDEEWNPEDNGGFAIHGARHAQ